MEKAIQAIEITPVTTGNKGNPGGNTAENGDSPPFAEVLVPAESAQAAESAQPAAPAAGAASAAGNNLPEEQSLPEITLPASAADETPVASGEVTQQAPLLETAAEPGVAPLPGLPLASPDSESPVTAVERVNGALTGDELTPDMAVGEHDPVESPVAIPQAGQVPAMVDLPQADPALPQVVSITREIFYSSHRIEFTPAPPQQAQPAPTTPAADAAQAAVRAGVQQAIAAQAGSGELQQSLDGSRQEAPQSLRAVTASQATPSTAFSSLLTDVNGTTGSARINVPVGEAGWARAVGEQVVWHVSQNIQSASLRLNPQHLGPLEMQVQMDGERATLAFASQHAVVRDALESALPRLREMFAQGGLEIVDVNVSQQQRQDGGSRQADVAGGAAAGEDAIAAEDEPVVGTLAGVQETHGLVDYYI